MKKVFFFGAGNCAKRFAGKVEKALKSLENFQVMGFLDNDPNKVGTKFEGYEVYKPDVIKKISCDMILLFLWDDKSLEIAHEQLYYLKPIESIYRYDYPLKVLIRERYKDSTEAEIKETLEYISNNKMSVFNQFIKDESTYDEVKWDKHNDLPYIDFMTVDGEKVPMYYPRNYEFIKKEGKLYVLDLMLDQCAGSPHLYIKENHKICDGDSIIDAGVCEGNFALKYVNIASHIYLFEMDPIWQEPLRYTFKNYENKITIVNKAVSDKTTKRTCKIDDIVMGEEINFIKMDVEGAELLAIRGAEQTFCRNDVKSSICCYHRRMDEKEIRLQLGKYGYKTSVSKGYMIFLYSDDTWEEGDLRHGIVYGNR